jgi:ABC-type bacteriocin/lantibiotic exporter with double-glycine peptidase domain
MPRYACVEQLSEEDCGAACVATVAQQHGVRLPLGRVRTLVGTGATGTTLLGLRRGAEALGFQARMVRARPELLDQLDCVSLPLILHWQGDHWVVLHGKRRGRFVVADPAVGLRLLSREELLAGWRNGVVLLLEPDAERLATLAQDRPSSGVLGRFWRQLRPFRPLLLQALAINAVLGLLSLAMPLLTQILTDDVLIRRDTQLLTSLGIGMLLLYLFQALMELIEGHLIAHFAQRLQLGMVQEYGHKLLSLPLSHFESRRSGEVVSRVSDVSQVNALITDLVLGLPSQLFMAVVSLAVMASYNLNLTLVALASFTLVVLSNLVLLPSLQQRSRNLIVKSAENQGFLVEIFRGAQLLKTTEATSQAWEEYQTNFGRLANLRWQSLQLQLIGNGGTDFLSNITSLGLLWYGSSFVVAETLSLGQLLAFSAMGSHVLSFLHALVAVADDAIAAQVVVRRLGEVLDSPSEEADARAWVTLPQPCPIQCQGLSYSHPGRVELIRDLDLEIPAGRCTALIGPSGCGKSTLVKCLAGLYPPQAGTIHYGAYGLRDLSLDCLRQQVCLVPQDTHFFNRSILENFRFAYPQVSFEEVVEACRLSLADAFIRELPDGYHTVLGEFGANLSGGQRQRLALARALVNRPAVLILDEATGALDPPLEARVMGSLLEERRGLTTLLISHRSAVIRRCDWVIQLERGALQAQGSPAQLATQPTAAVYLED